MEGLSPPTSNLIIPNHMHVYIGNFVHTPHGQLEFLEDHVLVVNQEGIIEFITPSSELGNLRIRISSVTTLKKYQFIFPGFIDTHAHAPQFPNCGIFGDSTLLDWLDTYTFPLEDKFKSIRFAQEVYTKLIARQIVNGTTLTCYFGSVHLESTLELAKICKQMGVRAHVGRVCMQQNCPDFLQQCCDESLNLDTKFSKLVRELDNSGEQLRPVITPRFAPTCSMETLKRLGSLANRDNIMVQTHISENANEIKWVKELFPDCSSYTDIYDKADLLKHDTVMAHAIHLSKDEIDIIKKRNCGISHCPNSNASIASGIAPIKKLMNEGIKVSLGSDISGGSTVSILKNARLALLMSRLLSERNQNNQDDILSVDNALFMATLGGAQVLNVDNMVGSFEIGKRFDAQLIDINAKGSPIDVFDEIMPTLNSKMLENLVHKWVYIGDDRNTVSVWVNGTKLK